MMNLAASPAVRDSCARPVRGQSRRPALTHLVLLAIANPGIVERLLRGDPLDVAVAHPHYVVSLDAQDRATLADIRSRARTVSEFLDSLADVVDGMTAEPEAEMSKLQGA